ncbi:MAG TPA: SDR family oxidoreductase [Candidatus Acidoferrales bacterium]|nr:SDR family oxidoreductase [Candidatus Acidoferrales bacterium]
MARELEGQVAIVTGAGRGIGRGIAIRLAAEGSAVALTSRNRAQLDQVRAQIEAAGGRALAVAGDATKREDVARVVHASREKFGGATLLVNNAGLAGPYGPVGVANPEKWWAAQEVHILAPFLFMTAVLPGMIERRAGRIINISSPRCHMLTANLSAYSLGKTAQNRLAELVANEVKEYGVHAFALDPGSIMTEMADETMSSPDAQRWVPKMVERLRELQRTQRPNDGMDWCTDRCVAFASGRYDALSGRYIDRTDDPEELLRQPDPKPPRSNP